MEAVLMNDPNACKHEPAEAMPSSSYPSEGFFPALLRGYPDLLSVFFTTAQIE